MDQLEQDLQKLRRQVIALATQTNLSQPPVGEYDAVISHVEINDRHGVGVLLGQLFRDSGPILAIRSHTSYAGDNWLGEHHYCISYEGLSRPERFLKVGQLIGPVRIKRILCVPFREDDVWTGIILHAMYGAPLCTYIMDDQNVAVNNINDGTLQELLQASALRLAISQEMAAAYERKYQLPFWLVPPIVSPELILNHAESSPLTATQQPTGEMIHPATGVLVGNIWSKSWLDQLRRMTRQTKLSIHWYGDREQTWLKTSPEELCQDGIIYQGFLPQQELVQKLREYPFAVVATSPLDRPGHDESPHAQAIARYSLPSRIPFMLATANIPIIVIGHPLTTAARFVQRFGVGASCEYDPQQFKMLVEWVLLPDTQKDIRQRAAKLARYLTSTGVRDWIWQSTQLGTAVDRRFEDLMPRLPDEITELYNRCGQRKVA
jgi:hypothetical protein